MTCYKYVTMVLHTGLTAGDWFMRLLIIEDEQDILNALVRGFKKHGFAADAAADGPAGLLLYSLNDYDLIILDLNLPGMDGIDILKQIRRTDKDQKILILSARTTYSERILGLDLGANDYLVKPFDFGELYARVRNLLLRSFTQQPAVLHFGEMTLDTSKRQVCTPGGNILDLSPKEYGILEYLLVNPNTPIPAEELIEHVWHEDGALFSNAVKVHISTLRKKLFAHAGKNIIKHIRGAGYLIEE